MMTWSEDGLVHTFSHVNTERRAGRTWCGRYVEFWPRDLVEDAVVSCLACITQPGVDALEGFDNPSAVDERWEDVVHRCTNHLYHRDEDGRCSRCGYGQARRG